MEARKVNKSRRNYRTGTQAAQALVVRSYKLFLIFVRTSARETRRSYRRHPLQCNLHNERVSLRKRDSLALGSVIFIRKYKNFGYESLVSRNETRSLCNKL